LSVKKINSYSGNHLASASSWTEINGLVTSYSFFLNLNTVEIESEFTAIGSSSVPLQTMFEIQWSKGSIVNSSATLVATINNDVIGGGEGFPTIGSSDFRATQAEAEAGVDNIKYMTPLRVRQALSYVTKDDTSTDELEIDAGTF
jgi:hypothetical protein